MSGKWADSTSRDDLPPDWPQRRDAVRRRAGGRCERRGRTGTRCRRPGSECDHIKPRWLGGTHELDNLQWLCPPCHARKTTAEAAQARAVIRARRYRKPEPHPGRITKE